VQSGAAVAAARLLAQIQKSMDSVNENETMAARLVLNHTDEMRRTALFLAVQAQDGLMSGALLAIGADTNKTDRHGTSPLHVACACGSGGDLALACLLAEHGASLSLRDRYGVLPLERSPLPWFRNEIIRRSTRPDLVLLCMGNPYEEQCANDLAYLVSEEDHTIATQVRRLDDFFGNEGLTHDTSRVAAFQQDDPWQLAKAWSLYHKPQDNSEKQKRIEASRSLRKLEEKKSKKCLHVQENNEGMHVCMYIVCLYAYLYVRMYVRMHGQSLDLNFHFG
jgi:hypothetical protein